MALPQQVIDRLTKEPVHTPGWSFGLLGFSAALFFLAFFIYFGLAWGYGPYLDTQLVELNAQVDVTGRSISADDQAKFVTFYSEITNLRDVLTNHVFFSRFLGWLENNTEANVYYTRMGFSNTDQVALAGYAKTEADVNQQAVIFETAPEVKKMVLGGVTFSEANGFWQFNVQLTMDPVRVLRAAPEPISP